MSAKENDVDLDALDADQLRELLCARMADDATSRAHIRELEKQYLLLDTKYRELETQYRALDGQHRELSLEFEDLTVRKAAEPQQPPEPVAADATPEAPAEPETVVDVTEPKAPEPVFPNAREWAHQWFAPLTARVLPKWCPQWWEHKEAVLRMDALWRTWEAARLDSVSGISSWMLHHFDPHMAQLTSPNGPFCACTQDGHGQPAQRLDPFAEPLRSASA